MLRLLLCQRNVESTRGSRLAVLLPHFGQILTQGCGVNARAGDGLPSDFVLSSIDGVCGCFLHVGFDDVLQGFDLCVDVVRHASQFCQVMQLGNDVVGAHLGFPPSLFRAVMQPVIGL